MHFKLLFVPLTLIASSIALEIRSPSGRLIPPSLLYHRLPRSSTPHPHLNPSDHIYEIISNHVKGYDINLDIFSETSRIHTNPRDSGFTYVENGAEARRLSRSSHVRMGNRYTVMYGDRNSEERHDVIAVHGHGLKLVPLDRDNYPGILVNIGSRSRLQPGGDDIIRIKLPEDVDFGDEPTIETEVDATDNTTRQLSFRQSSPCQNGVRHYFEVAIAYDHTFCAMFGGDSDAANAFIQSVVDTANIAYKKDTCIEVCLVHVESNCQAAKDPYKDFDNFPASFPPCNTTRGAFTPCDPSSYILYNFRTYWNDNRGSVHRDAAYLFTGFEDGTSVAGVAFLSAACGSVGYGWIEGTSALVFAHEAGHTLGADHSGSGIMVASGISQSDFSAQSQTDFQNYIDGGQTCITTEKCKFDPVTCPNARGGKCIPGVIVPSGLVPCSSVSSYYCVEEKYGRNFAEDCPKEYEYVRESPNPSDPTIRCCKPTSDTKSDVLVPRSTNLAGIRLNVNGRSEVFYNWLPDTSAFVTKTLMKTKVVPDCSGGGGSPTGMTPPPTSSPSTFPNTTPSPVARSTPTRSPSSSPATRVPSASPAVTASAAPPASTPAASPVPPNASNDSCGGNFASGQTFSCTKKSVVLRFQSAFLGIKPVSILFGQEYGLFRTVVRTHKASLVTHYAVVVSTDQSIDASSLPLTSVMKPESRPILSKDFDPFAMKLPGIAGNCCAEDIYIHVRIRLCRAGSTRNCGMGSATASKKMSCKNSCSRPFSASRKCPVCS